MKRKISSFQPLKSLLLAGLLAGPMLAFNTMAATREDIIWVGTDVFTDAHGNQAAYWNDPANWNPAVVPLVVDTNQVQFLQCASAPAVP
jgi:hypothetical protein